MLDTPPWGAWTRENTWLQLGIVMLDTPLGGLFCELVGSPDHVISRGFRTKRAAPFFYEGKLWSADPVIYRGSEMGGQLSSSGHAKNALLQLKIRTLPRNLSQNNSAGP